MCDTRLVKALRAPLKVGKVVVETVKTARAMVAAWMGRRMLERGLWSL